MLANQLFCIRGREDLMIISFNCFAVRHPHFRNCCNVDILNCVRRFLG